jgi:hypothetical protein
MFFVMGIEALTLQAARAVLSSASPLSLNYRGNDARAFAFCECIRESQIGSAAPVVLY